MRVPRAGFDLETYCSRDRCALDVGAGRVGPMLDGNVARCSPCAFGRSLNGRLVVTTRYEITQGGLRCVPTGHSMNSGAWGRRS